MEENKEFIKKAIGAVYKESLLKEDEKLEALTLKTFEDYEWSEKEEKELKDELVRLSNKYRKKTYNCYIDGAVDNQSEELRAGIGFVIYLDDKTFYKHQYKLAETYTAEEVTQSTSSHIAEYQAMISLLRVMSEQILRPELTTLKVYSDSETLVGQYYGEFRVTNPIQKKLRKKILDLSKRFRSVEMQWIPREKNIIANQLAQKSFVLN